MDKQVSIPRGTIQRTGQGMSDYPIEKFQFQEVQFKVKIEACIDLSIRFQFQEVQFKARDQIQWWTKSWFQFQEVQFKETLLLDHLQQQKSFNSKRYNSKTNLLNK